MEHLSFTAVLRQLVGITKGRRILLSVLTLLSLIQSLAEASLPVGLGVLVNTVNEHNIVGLISVSTFLVAAVLIRITASISAHILDTRIGIDIRTQHKERVAKHVISYRGVFDKGLNTGDVVEVAEDDISAIARGFSAIEFVIVGLGTYTVAGVYLLTQSWRVGVSILIAVPILCLFLPKVLHKLRKHLAEYRKTAGAMTSMAIDAATGHRVLSCTHGRKVFLASYHNLSTEMKRKGLNVANTRALIDGLRELIPASVLLAVLGIALLQWQYGWMNVGQIVSFYGLATYLLQPVTALISSLQQFVPAAVGLEREQRVLSSGREPHRGVSVIPEVKTVMDPQIGIRITPGYTVLFADALSEMSGIAERLAGADNEGRGLINGVSYSVYSEKAIRERATLLDTDASLVSGTLSEILGGSEYPDAVKIRALQNSSLGELMDSFSDGLDHYITDGGRNLSGGQRQRLLLAKALVPNPAVLVLVEPTSALDTVTEKNIIEQLYNERKDAITVVATHSPAHIRHSDTVLWIRDNALFMSGSHQELMKNPQYREMFINLEEI